MFAMENISLFFNRVYRALASVQFELLITVALCVYGGLAAVYALACLFSQKLRSVDKRPIFHFVNAFSVLFFALMLTGAQTAQALFFSAVFWLAGYLYYGAVCALARPVRAARQAVAANVVSSLARPSSRPAVRSALPRPAPADNVRLDHALSIADKLLLKNLARADRQELEKIKTSLTVIQVKGSPSPQESEIINSQFNALIKLMAKYDL